MLKLANPVLQGVDGYHTQDVLGRGAAQEHFNKTDNLQGFPQSHGVGEDAPKPRRGIEPHQRFYNVVIEKSNSTNLINRDRNQDIIILYVTMELLLSW